MNQVVAFDLDGTLVESDRYLLPAYRGALVKMGLAPIPDETLLQLIGGTYEDNRQLVMSDRPASDFAHYCDLIVELALKDMDRLGRTYAHIPEALDALRAQGCLTVLCSNGDPSYVDPILKALGLLPHLSHIQRIGHGMNKSQLLASIIKDFDAKGHTVMVGDRTFDARAARDNGAFFCGCLYGIFPGEITASHPDAVVSSADELPGVMARLLA